MPRYFFHLRNDVRVDDEEGQELASVNAARERAADYAVEMAAISIVDTRTVNLHHCIEVADEQGAVVLTVEFGDVLTVIA